MAWFKSTEEATGLSSFWDIDNLTWLETFLKTRFEWKCREKGYSPSSRSLSTCCESETALHVFFLFFSFFFGRKVILLYRFIYSCGKNERWNERKTSISLVAEISDIFANVNQSRSKSFVPLDQRSENKGRVPFDQNFRQFRFKIKWNRKFPETHFENFGQPLEVVLFSGNLKIPEIFRYIWHFYPAWIGPSSSGRAWKLQDGGESILLWMENELLQFEPCIDCLSSTNTFGSAFLQNSGLAVPNFLWAFAWFAYSPVRNVGKFIISRK